MPDTASTSGEIPHQSQFTRNRAHLSNFVLSNYPSRSETLLKDLLRTEHNGGSEQKHRQVKMNILVIGAGLGGLATSIALARRGHKVTVLEQAQKLGEVGAGIQIPPNSARLLKSWGIDPYFENKVVTPESMTFRRWEDGTPIGYTKLVPEFEETYKAPYYVIHRADFHESLHKLALQHGVEVIINSKVCTYDEENATVETVRGERYSADLVVAADGVNSTARRVVLRGEEEAPKLTGFAAYRATVSTEMMAQDPDTAWLLERPGLNIWIGEDRHVMTYCIAGGKTFNMVLSHVDHTEPATWSNGAAISEMRANFAGWDPKLTKVIDMIKTTVKWPLMNGSRLSTWVSKSQSLVILGDAAHAMVPYMSQGAAMAVEDGAALAESLSLIESKEDVGRALSIFEQVRMKRSYDMQSASLVNGILWHFPDGPEQEARDRGMKAEVEQRPYVQSTNQWSDPVTQLWAYAYDAEEAIRECWAADSLGK
ncbi:FAD/NAD(P)-binding domain-containing protein [Sarocladium strictum]